MPRRNQEFHQIVTVLEHICEVSGVTKVPLAFCCPFWTSSSSSSLFGMHHQCVAPLAANSPHSSLCRAILIASSKVRLRRDRSFFRVAIQEEWGRPTGLLQSLHSRCVILIFGQKRSKCSAVSSPVPQWGQIGDVICPIKAWYEAVDVSLLSLSWLIVLCACRETPGGILELSWPLQHHRSKLTTA